MCTTGNLNKYFTQDIKKTYNYHGMRMYIIIKSNMPNLGVNSKLIRCKWLW